MRTWREKMTTPEKKKVKGGGERERRRRERVKSPSNPIGRNVDKFHVRGFLVLAREKEDRLRKGGKERGGDTGCKEQKKIEFNQGKKKWEERKKRASTLPQRKPDSDKRPIPRKEGLRKKKRRWRSKRGEGGGTS